MLLQKLQTLSQNITHTDETIESPSPSRTAQSMTSGDLADISSISTTPSIPSRHSRLSARLSKTGSKSSSSSSLPKVSPTQVSPPGGTKMSSSDAVVRRSSSSLASVAFSDLMSSTVNLPLQRRKSAKHQTNMTTVSMETNSIPTEQKSSDMTKLLPPALQADRQVAMETTNDRPQPPSDTMIFTSQWLAKESFGLETGRHFGARTAVIGQNFDQPPPMYPRRSSSSLAPSDVLFPDDDDGGQKRLSKDSRFSRSTSSSSLKQAVGSFSTEIDRTVTDGRRSEADDHLFSRPGQPLPRRSGHVITAGQPKHPHAGSSDIEKDPEVSTNVRDGKAAGEKDAVDEKSDRWEMLYLQKLGKNVPKHKNIPSLFCVIFQFLAWVAAMPLLSSCIRFDMYSTPTRCNRASYSVSSINEVIRKNSSYSFSSIKLFGNINHILFHLLIKLFRKNLHILFHVLIKLFGRICHILFHLLIKLFVIN